MRNIRWFQVVTVMVMMVFVSPGVNVALADSVRRDAAPVGMMQSLQKMGQKVTRKLRRKAKRDYRKKRRQYKRKNKAGGGNLRSASAVTFTGEASIENFVYSCQQGGTLTLSGTISALYVKPTTEIHADVVVIADDCSGVSGEYAYLSDTTIEGRVLDSFTQFDGASEFSCQLSSGIAVPGMTSSDLDFVTHRNGGSGETTLTGTWEWSCELVSGQPAVTLVSCSWEEVSLRDVDGLKAGCGIESTQ
jgi:hypothetical protein